MSHVMIEAVGVGKRFGAVTALAGVDLAVPAGSVLGLLGHNGAGKTTLVNILATLVQPSSGTARVAGYDVALQSHQVRRRIGLTGQFAALDEQISGRDNLVLLARLLGGSGRQARARGAALSAVRPDGRRGASRADVLGGHAAAVGPGGQLGGAS